MRFVSPSLGYRACRPWCVSAVGQRFPHAASRARIAPWLERERTEHGPLQFPREGVGCWHPVCPARADDIWLLASAAVKQIEEVVAGGRMVAERTARNNAAWWSSSRMSPEERSWVSTGWRATMECSDFGDDGDHVWRSRDGRFGLRVPRRTMAQLCRWCWRSGRRETGGILVGHHSASVNCAVVAPVRSCPGPAHDRVTIADPIGAKLARRRGSHAEVTMPSAWSACCCPWRSDRLGWPTWILDWVNDHSTSACRWVPRPAPRVCTRPR